MKKYGISYLVIISCIMLIFSCQEKKQNTKFKVVTTTNMISDLLHQIGGDSIEVVGLMGAGVDPHLYKASEGDVSKLTTADAIFYNGLHLEGKMVDVFEKMNKSGYKTFALSDGLPEANKISSANFAGNYDPHIWFSVENWRLAAKYVTKQLSALQPQNKEFFEKNLRFYDLELKSLKEDLNEIASKLPKEKRILVTAHDAFSYFGKEFDFEVVGLQGITTTAEAGTKDILDLANFIVENDVPAIFVESSVPEQTILALKSAVEAKGKDVVLGGTLYSDSLGNSGTPEGTYLGMYLYNMSTIVNALNVTE